MKRLGKQAFYLVSGPDFESELIRQRSSLLLLAQRLASVAVVAEVAELADNSNHYLLTNPILESAGSHSHQTWHVHLAALDRPIT